MFFNNIKPVSLFKFISSSGIKSYQALYSGFAVKDFLYDLQGDIGTIKHKFVKYIALNNENNSLVKDKIKYPQFYPVVNERYFLKELNKIDNNQIKKLINYTYTYKTNADLHKLVYVVNEIDNLCLSRLKKLTISEILDILYYFYFLIPNKITKLHFFERSIEKLISNVDANLGKNDYIKMVFFVGLLKNNYNNLDLYKIFDDNLLNKYLPMVNLMEFSILCSAAYKTSTTINNMNFIQRITEEIINCNSKDFLINLVKSARHNKIKSNSIKNKLSELITSDEINNYELTSLVHLFAYYAENDDNNKIITSALISNCLDKINTLNNEKPKDLRLKDFAGFLWACGFLNLKSHFTSDDFVLIKNIIIKNINNDQYKYNVNDFIDTLFSLFLLNYYDKHLMSIVANSNLLNYNYKSDRTKLQTKKDLVLSCMRILSKDKVQFKCSKAPNYLVKNRYDLIFIENLLNNNEYKDKYNIKHTSFVLQIDYLNIAGIEIEYNNSNKKCYMEILDYTNTLIDNVTANGLLELKFNLLKKQNCDFHIINAIECKNEDIIAQVNNVLENNNNMVKVDYLEN